MRIKASQRRAGAILTLLMLVVAIALSLSQGAQAAPRSYQSCSALNKDFRYGVAKTAKAVNRGKGPIFTPKVSSSVYTRNLKLDSDRDFIVCEVVKPQSSGTDASINDNTSTALVERILKSYQGSESQVDYKINFRLCPGITAQRANDLVTAYKRAMKYWSQFYVPKQPVDWVLMGESDYDCWLENVKQLEGAYSDRNVWNSQTNIMGHCQVSAYAFCGYGTAVRPNGVFVQYNLVGSRYQGKTDQAVVHHESVHLYQMSLQSENIATSRVSTLPPWFVEGQANVFGPVISSSGNYANYRAQEISRLKKVYPNAASMTATQWTAELHRLESQHDFVFKNELGYSLGWLVLERIYQDYSLNQMHKLLLEINKGSDWSSALVKVLSISREDLYTKLGIYLATQFN